MGQLLVVLNIGFNLAIGTPRTDPRSIAGVYTSRRFIDNGSGISTERELSRSNRSDRSKRVDIAWSLIH